ncbi:Low affinity iron permease, Fet4, partial [Microbacterium laevaniformans OR221]
TGLSAFMGHILTVFGFWVCIFIWIGFGKYCDWSNTWQLYINSATSALMVFVLAFLANIRERHTKYMTKCLESIWEVDASLELKLRTATGDTV